MEFGNMETWECGMEFLVDREGEGGRKEGTGARIKQKTTHIGSGKTNHQCLYFHGAGMWARVSVKGSFLRFEFEKGGIGNREMWNREYGNMGMWNGISC